MKFVDDDDDDDANAMTKMNFTKAGNQSRRVNARHSCRPPPIVSQAE